MTDNNRVESFVEAILADRPPRPFPAGPDDTQVLRVAVELRAHQSQFAAPSPQFVERLHRDLAATDRDGLRLEPVPAGVGRRRDGQRVAPLRPRRRRGLVGRPLGYVGKAAAALVLVAGTVTATNLMSGHTAAPVAARAPGTATVRSGVLLSADGRPVGRTYAYTGSPSWVFMDVHGSSLSGVYTCELELADGSVVPAGVVVVYNGTGDWAHTVTVPVSKVRRARLVNSRGATVATAAFS